MTDAEYEAFEAALDALVYSHWYLRRAARDGRIVSTDGYDDVVAAIGKVTAIIKKEKESGR